MNFGTATYRSWTSHRVRAIVLGGATIAAVMTGSSLTHSSFANDASAAGKELAPANAAAAAPRPATPAAVPPSVSVPAPAFAGGRRVVGYFPLWARNSGYTEANVDFSAINQVNHFSLVPRADGTLEVPDWGPFPDPKLVNAAHTNGARISLVIGGDHEAATRGFAGMTASPAARQRFAANVQQMLSANGYDGVDLDWEFPTSAADRDNFTRLVSDLRATLGPSKTISIAAPGSSWYGQWLDIPALTPLVDWVGAMTYSLSGSTWSKRADHNAALYAVDDQALSLDTTRAYYLGRGLQADKLLLGISFYGQRFEGASNIYQPLSSTAGTTPTFPEVNQLIGHGWTSHRDTTAGVPYLTRDGGQGVISYDDPESIATKCQYVKDEALGGMIIWQLGQDRTGTAQPLLAATRACR